jgi:competence protein ComEC
MKEGRLANSQNAILFAAAAMLAINPLLLRYDVGFQLSFLATLGIVYLYPLFEKNFFAGEQNILKETILMTLAAQFFVLPVILANFEKISIISPLANLLILPAIPYIMLGGFAAGIAGFIFVPLGKLIGFVPYILLKFELAVVQCLADISWSSLEIKNFGWKHILVYYFILISMLYYFKRKDKKPIALADED